MSYRRGFEDVDQMPKALRECVHDFGLPIVSACVDSGVTSPNRIRQLVREIWDGARQTRQRTAPNNAVDWILAQSGSGLTARQLYRFLADHGLVVVSVEPTRCMLNASMAEVSGFNVRCTREEKHRRRLRAAALASIQELTE